MHFEPHATLGWVIGNVGGGDRRLRNYCTLGAVLPDIDAVPYIFGAEAYGRWHHTFGHNIFFWAAFTAWVTWRCRSWRAFVLSFLSFGSHLLTDAQLSGWDLYLFWPLNRKGFLFPHAVGLEHPINYWLVYASFVVVLLVALIYKRTPLDIFSPKIDALFVSWFRRKTVVCAACGRPCNQRCAACSRPVCVRHASLRRGIRLLCPDCNRGKSV